MTSFGETQSSSYGDDPLGETVDELDGMGTTSLRRRCSSVRRQLRIRFRESQTTRTVRDRFALSRERLHRRED
jgi:hypothetical protein